jgi:hypothetical protein
MILMLANPLLRPLEGRGPENLNFFGPKWHFFRALVMDVAHIKTIMPHAI